MEEEMRDRLWCYNLLESLAIGGQWGIPRSGLIFRRRIYGLQLVSAMPYHPNMPISREELQTFQREDFELIKDRFEKVGATVTALPGVLWSE